MTGIQLRENMKTLRVSVAELASIFCRDQKTIRRWQKSPRVYGPAAAAVEAWLRLKRGGYDWYALTTEGS